MHHGSAALGIEDCGLGNFGGPFQSIETRGIRGKTYPSSKCLQRLSGSCFLVLHDEHSCSTELSNPRPRILLSHEAPSYQPENDLLGGLRLLVEDGLGLTTVTGLLAVVTAFTLRERGGLAGLVLSDLVQGVLVALAALAEGLPGLGNVHHFGGWIRS